MILPLALLSRSAAPPVLSSIAPSAVAIALVSNLSLQLRMKREPMR
jgi:hypothetical protein